MKREYKTKRRLALEVLARKIRQKETLVREIEEQKRTSKAILDQLMIMTMKEWGTAKNDLILKTHASSWNLTKLIKLGDEVSNQLEILYKKRDTFKI